MNRRSELQVSDGDSPASVQAEGRSARILRKSDALATRVIAQETLIVPFRGTLASLRQIFALNPVAAFVWERIDGETTLDSILADVVATFDVERERARSDLNELIADMLEAGLVDETGGEPETVERT